MDSSGHIPLLEFNEQGQSYVSQCRSRTDYPDLQHDRGMQWVKFDICTSGIRTSMSCGAQSDRDCGGKQAVYNSDRASTSTMMSTSVGSLAYVRLPQLALDSAVERATGSNQDVNSLLVRLCARRRRTTQPLDSATTAY